MDSPGAVNERRTVGYQILLPPGWAQIPLRAGVTNRLSGSYRGFKDRSKIAVGWLE
jgi:hypothetical protein